MPDAADSKTAMQILAGIAGILTEYQPVDLDLTMLTPIERSATTLTQTERSQLITCGKNNDESVTTLMDNFDPVGMMEDGNLKNSFIQCICMTNNGRCTEINPNQYFLIFGAGLVFLSVFMAKSV